MYKQLAKTYALDEKTMEKGSLRTLFWLLVASVPLFPLLAIVDEMPIIDAVGLGWLRFDAPGWMVGLLAAIAIASFGALVVLCTNKLTNRLGMPDKYLDEWEIAQKRASMTFALRFSSCVIAAVASLRLLGEADGWIAPVEVSFTTTLYAVLWLMLYAFSFHLVLTVRPMEADPMAKPETYDWQLSPAERDARKTARRAARRPIWIMVGAIASVIVLSDIYGAVHRASLFEAAVETCEGRGTTFSQTRSEVKDWVSVDWSNATCADGSPIR